MIEIVQALPAHIPSLIDLARSVEHLFGPMIGHGFERVLETNVDRGAILCAIDPDGLDHRVLGGIIFDVRDAPMYHVSWLAVSHDFRGCGIGRRLLASALERASPPARIELITFGPDNEGDPDGLFRHLPEGLTSRQPTY